MTNSFVHLVNHTEYSIGKGIIRINGLIDAAIRERMLAVAITDNMNLFGVVKFYQRALAMGIKPIIGCELNIIDNYNNCKIYQVVVLCQNNIGYKNLMKIISTAYGNERVDHKPVVTKELLFSNSTGLICLLGSHTSEIYHHIINDERDKAADIIKTYHNVFVDRLYLAADHVIKDTFQYYLQTCLSLGYAQQIPLVAVNNCLFLEKTEYDAQCVRVCIDAGMRILEYNKQPQYFAEQYFKTTNAMQELFQQHDNIIHNSVLIAARCNVQLHLGEVFLPNFNVPDNYNVDSYLEHLANSGLTSKIKDVNTVYKQRLQEEITVISKMGYSGYFLIVYDFINWSKNNNVPVGPGRGSGAGSLVAYSLGITNIDPIKYDLLFERFLNPERVSMPDFDIDFCIEGRDRVIEYVANKYGQHNVAQIITFGTMAAKAVVRDVGRVLGQPYGLVDQIARLIPMELGITLTKALKEEELQNKYQQDEVVKAIIDMALQLEGLVRNAGKHAGGVVMAPEAIDEFAPIYRENIGESTVTQYDKDDIEQVGLVKFDLLGLKTLTVINKALAIIKDSRKINIDINNITLDDQKTYQLISDCNTTAVFQLESRGMKDLIARMQPDQFEEIIALVALFRPGPLQSGMVDDFINRKHKKQAVEYIHPDLEPILATTYGVILYQEQVMEIARKIGGYTLGSADILRRAMGKKKPQEMAKQRSTFLQGAIAKQLSNKLANTIFDLMEKFSSYGFNKSHSAAYALLSYQTAYLKANYPAEFMAAVLSCDLDHTDKIASLLHECKFLGIKVLPPSINHSAYEFSIDSGAIRYGLGAIKGLGKNIIEMIIASRSSQRFTNVSEFLAKVNLQKVTKKNIEILGYAGALDELADSRQLVMQSINNHYIYAEKQQQEFKSGQGSLFATAIEEVLPIHNTYDLTTKEYLSGELSALGFYFSIHPVDLYDLDIACQDIMPIAKVGYEKLLTTVTIVGMIRVIKRVVTRKGDPMYFVTIDDKYDVIDILVFHDVYQAANGAISKDQVVMVKCNLSYDNNNTLRVRADAVTSLQLFREQNCQAIEVFLVDHSKLSQQVELLSRLIREKPGGNCALFVRYELDGAIGKFKINNKFTPESDIIWNLTNEFGVDNVKIRY